MKHLILYFLLAISTLAVHSEPPVDDKVISKTVVTWNDTSRLQFFSDPAIYSEGWDTLAHSLFWKEIMNMSSDSFLINIAYCRKPIDKVSRSVWMNQTEPEKIFYKDSLSQIHCVDSSGMLYVTSGKKEFYEVRKTLYDINTAITVFKDMHCDPWYAQTILLIESPGRYRAKSSVGALGPFQLMPAVARKYGLSVTKTYDDRTDLKKSARAASRLINSACIPSVRNMLTERNIEFKESDLWFRLLVLHAYHAGSGNVRCVINSLNPNEGGLALFQKIWQTTCATFKNESQNYSQIALGALLNFDELIHANGDTVFLVHGDKYFREYLPKNQKSWEAYEYLSKCLSEYESDFIDGVIPYDYFMKQVSKIRNEFSHIANVITKGEMDIVLKKYPAGEGHINALAASLTKRHRYEDAIRMLKINLDMNPESAAVHDSLARAYRLSGDRKMAELHMSKSANLSRANTP